MPRFGAIFIEWLKTCDIDLILNMSNGPADGPNAVDGLGTGMGSGQYPNNIGFGSGQNPDGYDTMLFFLNPATGLDSAMHSEVPSGNEYCSAEFNHDPSGGVKHGHKNGQDWYYETQQKHESLRLLLNQWMIKLFVISMIMLLTLNAYLLIAVKTLTYFVGTLNLNMKLILDLIKIILKTIVISVLLFLFIIVLFENPLNCNASGITLLYILNYTINVCHVCCGALKTRNTPIINGISFNNLL